MSSGFRVGRVAGIDVVVDWSLAVTFTVLMFSLGGGLLLYWRPDWSPLLRWSAALVATTLLFGSVLAHELAHALVGRARGLHVKRITLFIFGGVAQLASEPSDWRTELGVALVGPLTSLALALALALLGSFAAGELAIDPAQLDRLPTALDAVATVLLWLSQVNLILALFNLVPGFPLDGGRALRAVLWGLGGDLRQATRRASRLGQLCSALLIATGLVMLLGLRVPFFGAGFAAGLWLILIGWFLNNAAVARHRQLLARSSLENIAVAQVMRVDFASVHPAMLISELVDHLLLPGDQRAFPVLEDGRFVGLVCFQDIRQVPRAAWGNTPVRDIMTPAPTLNGIPPGENAADAMLALGRHGVNQLPVVENGQVRGLVLREDLMKLLSVYGDPALAS